MSDIIPQKRCPKCDRFLPATKEFFYSNKSTKDGLTAYCSMHMRETTNQYRQEHRDEMNERVRIQKKILKEQGLPTYNVEWQRANRERRNEQERQRRRANPEQFRKKQLRYQQSEYGRIKMRALSRTRKARKRGVGGSYTVKDVERQLKAQKGKCYWCSVKFGKGKNAYHVDHIIPITREGSSNDPWNLVLACPSCNVRRRNKLPHEWPEGGRLF